MIKAHHTRFGRWFWTQFSKWSIKLRFHAFHYEKRIAVDPNRSVFLLGNHISWWDGFWSLRLNHKFLGKRFHVMMLEAELKKRRFLSHVGAFSIDPKKRTVLESLGYAAALLEKPENLVVIYPQGKIHAMSDHRIRFEKGIERVLEKCGEEVQVVFSVVLVDYFEHAKPTVWYYLEEWEGMTIDEQGLSRAESRELSNKEVERIEEAYNRFYRSCLAEHRQRTA